MADILVCMFSTYYKQDRELERSTKVVVMCYMHSWFLFDVLACIPFDLVINIINSGQDPNCNSFGF